MSLVIYGSLNRDALNLYRRLGVDAVSSDIEGVSRPNVAEAKGQSLRGCLSLQDSK
ncbi:MAG: hypothetical protein ACUVTM_03805 [Candidatus Bathyarchaeia archaeon]